jgi:serine/threonine protein phosphatase PrpC
MRTYATAQNTGTRSEQCDATAVRTIGGARAFALLDGIGSSPEVRAWTRNAAGRLAERAARHGDAETGLRGLYDTYAADPFRQDHYLARYEPKAAAIVAVTTPGSRLLTVAWCGDARGYLLRRGITLRLTQDHNLRRVWPPTANNPHGGNRNMITSCLGSALTDEQVKQQYGHPAIESTTQLLDGPCRLLLATDGAYEPHEDAGHDLVVELGYEPLAPAVRQFVDLAVATSENACRAVDPTDIHADNSTALLADLPL